MSSLNWTHEIILDLIESYRAKPVLWDATMKEYSDRNKRRDAWKYIGNVVGVTDIVLVEKKVRSLRTHFLSVHKDYLKKKGRSGSGSEEIPKPKWFAYELLLFLTKVEKNRATRDILVGAQDDGAITNDKERVDGKVTEDDANFDDSTIAEEPELKRSRSEQNREYPSCTQGNTVMTEKRKMDRDKRFDDSCPVMNGRNEMMPLRDEFTIFGEYVAVRLRKIRDPQVSLQLQHQINSLLFEGEMNNFASGEDHNSEAHELSTQYS